MKPTLTIPVVRRIRRPLVDIRKGKPLTPTAQTRETIVPVDEGKGGENQPPSVVPQRPPVDPTATAPGEPRQAEAPQVPPVNLPPNSGEAGAEEDDLGRDADFEDDEKHLKPATVDPTATGPTETTAAQESPETKGEEGAVKKGQNAKANDAKNGNGKKVLVGKAATAK